MGQIEHSVKDAEISSPMLYPLHATFCIIHIPKQTCHYYLHYAGYTILSTIITYSTLSISVGPNIRRKKVIASLTLP